METRNGHGVRVEHAADIVVTHTPADRPADIPDPDPDEPAPPRRRLAVVLAVVLAVAVVVTLLLTMLADDEDVVTRPEPGTAALPSGPEPLTMRVGAPAEVVAGQTARLVVRWSDGSGIFSGGSEAWGDGVATSSIKQGRCAPTAGAPEPAAGTYRATHTWSEPGTYTVEVGVTTYSCEGGTVTEEQATDTVTVEVVPAG